LHRWNKFTSRKAVKAVRFVTYGNGIGILNVSIYTLSSSSDNEGTLLGTFDNPNTTDKYGICESYISNCFLSKSYSCFVIKINVNNQIRSLNYP
jgi:hypothetical protein